ncbi:MAG: hypothetical protein MMC33_005460 [Icmadophila ericetorum]|nr:hypothetical protein [Icmadophila ericetorum]
MLPFAWNETALSVTSLASQTPVLQPTEILPAPRSVDFPFFGNINIPAVVSSILARLNPNDDLSFDSFITGFVIPDNPEIQTSVTVPRKLTVEEELELLKGKIAKAQTELEDAQRTIQLQREGSTAILEKSQSELEVAKVKLDYERRLYKEWKVVNRAHIGWKTLQPKKQDKALEKAALREQGLKEENADLKINLYDAEFEHELQSEYCHATFGMYELLKEEQEMQYNWLFQRFIEAEHCQAAAEDESAAISAKMEKLFAEKELYREKLAFCRFQTAELYEDVTTIDEYHAKSLYDTRRQGQVWWESASALRYERDMLERENFILASTLVREKQISEVTIQQLEEDLAFTKRTRQSTVIHRVSEDNYAEHSMLDPPSDSESGTEESHPLPPKLRPRGPPTPIFQEEEPWPRRFTQNGQEWIMEKEIVSTGKNTLYSYQY